MWRMPYSFSALIHLSAIMPVKAGIKRDDSASVEKIAPNWGKVHPLAFRQYVPIVISHAPQTKNCRKLRTVRRSLIFMLGFLFSTCSKISSAWDSFMEENRWNAVFYRWWKIVFNFFLIALSSTSKIIPRTLNLWSAIKSTIQPDIFPATTGIISHQNYNYSVTLHSQKAIGYKLKELLWKSFPSSLRFSWLLCFVFMRKPRPSRWKRWTFRWKKVAAKSFNAAQRWRL